MVVPALTAQASNVRDSLLNYLFSPVTRIKGVGATTAKALERLLPAATSMNGAQLPIIRDLVFHLPVSLVDRRFTCPLREAPGGVIATFVVTVDAHQPPKQRRFGKMPYKVICSNDTGTLTLVFFHARDEYLKGALPVGAQRVVSGRTDTSAFELQMVHPDIIAPVAELAQVQRPEPVYSLTLGLSSKRIATLVEQALAKLPPLPEWQARTGAHAQGWPGFAEALQQAHHPEQPEDLLPTAPARQRLAYDELLARQLHLALLRRNRQRQPGVVIAPAHAYARSLLAALPFSLTGAQQAALADIRADMASGQRMGRLVQGDVGSGKTLVALLAMLDVAECSRQSALMAPTELIARQHYEVIARLVASAGSNLAVVLLTGSVKGAERKDALEKIARGAASIVIGTHALFQEQVQFAALSLVVVDEQHRFGVEQRAALASKGEHPHVLHMTATPIPRSLAMAMYGDMDSSLMQEKPPGRQPVVTRLVSSARYDEVVARLQAALARGEKAYWICPLVEAGEGVEHDVAAAQTRFTEFTARFGAKVALVHGRMKAEERDAQMQRFALGDAQLLVATTVVEVGVDVRDATIMVIEQAERFGLSQLHQLRGRVGRGDKASSCVLLYSEVDGGELGSDAMEPPSAIQRLSVLRETEDGFTIAEADLAQRGGGDLLGTRQSGLPRFIFLDLAVHQPLFALSREEARQLLAQPGSEEPAWRLLLGLFGYPDVKN
jgi:ATP-dependent DNA helicase RecG